MPCPLSYIRLVLKDIPFFLPISENTVLLPSVSFITTGKDTKRKGVKYSPHAFSYLTDSFQNYSTQLPLRSAPSRGRRLAQHDLEFYGTDISIHAVAGTATANITIFHRTILPQFQSYCTIISAFSHISSISHHRKALISVFFRCEPPRKFMFTSGSHRNRRMYAGL